MDAEESEYRVKLGQTAQTLTERIAVLEARDKLMRLKRLRQTDLATAVAIVGTCPDMCPEFERYFREDTNQMSSFELDADGKPDEYRMVKEYRRSGADQEEPLAHELRPVPVLDVTMDYLCTNIMDAFDVNDSDSTCGDWYDFVWSRTRSIRKDITQQHLCDVQSVSLMERCARFHIHCSATLCQQDARDFDARINEENLSNCLQSLKDSYYDLSLRDIYCPNEPEFRCYEILLHLNDTAILRDIQNYRQSIRESNEIKFAVKVLIAFHSNNYIDFFKLLNQSSYLMACLLHRYFNPMRLKAIKIFRKSYTSNNTSVVEYPSDLLINCLGFDDLDDLNQFCLEVGLECCQQFVYLIRGQNKVSVMKAKRSVRLVESKRTVSVGQIVNGNVLPSNPYNSRPVHNSFDMNNKLKSDSFDAIDQQLKANNNGSNSSLYTIGNQSINMPPIEASIVRPIHMTHAFQSVPYLRQQKAPQPTGLSPKLIDELCLSITNDLLDSMTEQNVSEICSQQFKIYHNLVVDDVVTQLFCDLIHDVIYDMVNETASNVIQEALKTKESRRLEQLFNDSNQVFDELITNEIICVSSDVLNKCLEEVKDKQNELLSKTIFNDFVDDMVVNIAGNVLNNALHDRREVIEFIFKQRISRLERKYFNLWKTLYLKRKRINFLRETFPAAPKWSSTDLSNLRHDLNDDNQLIRHLKQSFSDTADDNENEIKTQLLSKFILNYLIDDYVREIARHLLDVKISGNEDIVDYISDKHINTLMSKYFNKWKSNCKKRMSNLAIKRSFPAAPNWSLTKSKSSSNMKSLKTSILDMDCDNYMKVSPKRKRISDGLSGHHMRANQSDSSNLKTLIDEEIMQSKLFTKKLKESLSDTSADDLNDTNASIIGVHDINTDDDDGVNDDEEEVNGEQMNSKKEETKVVDLCESATDKMNRLKRLLAEEKDYFSYHNFVDYLSKSSPDSH
ncbi:germinal-center associated nuclear protein-like [Oppia nitens]|uniref:germinal-center associated nuclear protein-like n=1 Tax=Oppia nitens TaxID=1686743 RepID=UPI0023D9B058|nr:germinal-center associated nuclear protein-like [Oppia nitens]